MSQKTNKEQTKNKKQIDFEKYKLFEIPYWKVKFENEKSIFITIDANKGMFINKNNCYKSKKYEYKQVFLIKIFDDFKYEIRDNEDWEDVLYEYFGNKMNDLLEDINEEY